MQCITTIYAADELTIEAAGHQWYWSYEYTDYDFSYDSAIIDEETVV